MTEESSAIELDARTLRRWPLPGIPHDADKEARGRVLVVAGSREIPGAALLAGTAALRAGAGKLVMATATSVAGNLAIAMPEARVIALRETAGGALSMDGLALLQEAAEACDAALVGPGFMDETASMDFVHGLLPLLAQAPVVLDASAMNVLKRIGRVDQPVLLTPHAGEMAQLLGCAKDEVEASTGAVLRGAQQWNAVVALKGAATFIADPKGRLWRHNGGQPGLGTSGSGDVLAGLAAGFAARGAPLHQAAAWGVVLHALAGARLVRRMGPLGYLARELAGEIPVLMKQLQRRDSLKPPPHAPTE
jgi:ADP-dependent NAD(P)H-hydrate dehydratase